MMIKVQYTKCINKSHSHLSSLSSILCWTQLRCYIWYNWHFSRFLYVKYHHRHIVHFAIILQWLCYHILAQLKLYESRTSSLLLIKMLLYSTWLYISLTQTIPWPYYLQKLGKYRGALFFGNNISKKSLQNFRFGY